MAADQSDPGSNPQPPQLRLFYALWPDAATRAALVALQAGIGGRPMQPDNLHLTLAFLGNQPSTALPPLQALLATLPAAPLPLSLNHSGYFPRQHLAWIGPEPAPAALLELQQRLARALLQLPIHYRTTERFLPHVTLARKAASAAPAPATPIAWRSSQLALVCSTPLTHGTRYRILAARSLDGQADRQIPAP